MTEFQVVVYRVWLARWVAVVEGVRFLGKCGGYMFLSLGIYEKLCLYKYTSH